MEYAINRITKSQMKMKKNKRKKRSKKNKKSKRKSNNNDKLMYNLIRNVV